jgi:hypothetical protein
MTITTRMLQRRGNASQWTSSNPVLGNGEIGFESDTNKFKIGNGVTAWTSLNYFSTLSSIFSTANTFSNTQTFTPAATTGMSIIAKGLPSQTANLQEWQDSAATPLASIASTGSLTVPTILTTSTTDTTTSSNGSAIVSGGLNVLKNANVQKDLFVGPSAITQTAVTTNPIIIAKDAGATYAQIAMINSSATGSSDFAAYSDNGTDAAGWVDMGFTGSGFNDTNYTITGKNDGYIFTQAVSGSGLTGNLVLSTGSNGTTNDLVFGTGGFLAANEKMRFVHSTGTLNVKTTTASTTTTTGALVVGGGVGIAGATYIGGGLALSGASSPISLNGSVGTSGQVLTSAGTGATPTWTTISGSFTGGTLTSSLTVRAGTTTAATAPIYFQSGTNLTTPVAGAVEYDGLVQYFTPATGATATTNGGRAIVQTSHNYVIHTSASAITNSATAQKLLQGLATNGGISLAVGTYEVEFLFTLSNSGASTTSHTIAFNMLGTGSTATATASHLYAQAYMFQLGNTNSSTPNMSSWTSMSTSTVLTSATTTKDQTFLIKGTMNISGAGLVVPNITFSVAPGNTTTLTIGSYFKFTPIMSNTNTTGIGAWS